jgi:hypothetical protein
MHICPSHGLHCGGDAAREGGPSAPADLGNPAEIARVFAGFQKYLYQAAA